MSDIQVDLELREKWLQALESGEYKQARVYLNSKYGFCCLGVACEVAGIRKVGKIHVGDFYSIKYSFPKEQFILNAFIDNDLQCRLGISKYAGELTRMNDDEGKSFKEIASYIRERGIDND